MFHIALSLWQPIELRYNMHLYTNQNIEQIIIIKSFGLLIISTTIWHQ